MTGSTLLTAVYGYEVLSPDDSLFSAVEVATEGFVQALVVSNYLVNTFPWLEYVPQWFPGTAWKSKAKVWRNQKDQMINTPFEWTRNKMAAGVDVHCLLSTWLNRYIGESNVPIAEIEDRIRWAAGGMFAAGTDTSVATLRTFILAMAMHPDIQAKAQAEIDSAIGTSRSGLLALCFMHSQGSDALEDLTIPHGCTQDDVYKGYHIPKGAIVLGNAWAISNNPEVYAAPERFNPDRFLDPSVPDAPSFGFGRRICPGLHHAEAVIFITAAGLLAMFDIRPEADVNGNPIPLKADATLNEVLRQVLPFKCQFVPRSEKHEQTLREWVGM
ncbi:unnamed protein product [Rhizoctonia solani]|uniref:O-methylsterigmatocystin oxidoreductase n=1 Tax=Rhizoctonia solani TaxID=456999 RepID=A0A8H2X5X6_9AGAM|nr:unnamed protein product [Rhizoctonia solani]